MSPRIILAFVFCVVTVGSSATADESEEGLSAREKAFVDMLSNTTLIGSFTVDNKPAGVPRAERYEITDVSKLTDKLWTLKTRVKYGKTDVTIPVTIPVEWAGETPMVSLTDASLPGLGDHFSARVVFHDGRYAGTWQHGDVGGCMFGRFKKTKPARTTSD